MNKRVKIDVLRSDGARFSLENEEIGILELEGCDFAPIEISTEPRGAGDGDIIIGKHKTSRDIKVVCKLRDFSRYALKRQQIIDFFATTYSFDLWITYLGRTRIAKNCELKEASYPTQNIYTNPELTLLFLAADPDFYSADIKNVELSKAFALWHDTRVYEAGKPLAFGEIVPTDTVFIEYAGTENAPLIINLTFTGYETRVTVTVNGESLPVINEFSAGDNLIIDAEKMEILINGEPYWERWKIEYLVLHRGINEVTVIGETGQAFIGSITHTGRYGGV